MVQVVPRLASLVATLIAGPGVLDDNVVARARTALPAAAETQWLAPGTALDLSFSAESGTDQGALAGEIRGAVNAGVDVVVQPADSRRKRLFLADMDSTMIGQECIDELADFVGLKAHVAAITERAMRGEIAFEPALRERVALLKGLPVTVVDEVLRDRIKLTPGGRTLIATMRKHGAYTCLVSGGFTLFTDRIAAMIGFDANRANSLDVVEERTLAGTVAEPIFGRDGKRATLIELRDRFRLAPIETMAVGDGANDMAMIADAGLGVAYHAKPKVAAMARARIDHNDLSALLYVQGYRREEFVEV
ncbi:MAG TPA: phosphoserine phosphatase SerB [Pseudolabrys sp.]|nr:phosphoserine phosphatase SerB [Pseudolabrys sp.]